MIMDGSITGLGLSSFGHSVMPSSDVDLATAVNFCGEHAGAIAIELPAKIQVHIKPSISYVRKGKYRMIAFVFGLLCAEFQRERDYSTQNRRNTSVSRLFVGTHVLFLTVDSLAYSQQPLIRL